MILSQRLGGFLGGGLSGQPARTVGNEPRGISGGGNSPVLKPSPIESPQAPSGPDAARPNAFKKGGKVEKTGIALVHKGEVITPKNEVDKQEKGGSMQNVSLHRALSHLHKGGLHEALGVPLGKPIPSAKLEKAKNSDNPHIQHMANFASVLEGFHDKK